MLACSGRQVALPVSWLCLVNKDQGHWKGQDIWRWLRQVLGTCGFGMVSCFYMKHHRKLLKFSDLGSSWGRCTQPIGSLTSPHNRSGHASLHFRAAPPLPVTLRAWFIRRQHWSKVPNPLKAQIFTLECNRNQLQCLLLTLLGVCFYAVLLCCMFLKLFCFKSIYPLMDRSKKWQLRFLL